MSTYPVNSLTLCPFVLNFWLLLESEQVYGFGFPYHQCSIPGYEEYGQDRLLEGAFTNVSLTLTPESFPSTNKYLATKDFEGQFVLGWLWRVRQGHGGRGRMVIETPAAFLLACSNPEVTLMLFQPAAQEPCLAHHCPS